MTPGDSGPAALEITRDLRIPLSEIVFTAVRSSGPGGQHVNTTSTKVVLWFDVERSPSLDHRQRERIRERLGNRMGSDGRLQVAHGSSRSQKANKEAALEIFVRLLRGALAEAPVRRPTRLPRSRKERRLADKKRRSLVKRLRSGRVGPDE